jgi:putative oxidoreductase
MISTIRSWWPLPLRILIGIGFVYHGYPKLFSANGHHVFTGMLREMGVPAPQVTAWVSAIVEFFGGVALILGAAVSVATVLLIIDMLVALFTVHIHAGFSFLNVVATAEGPRYGLPGIEVNLLYVAGLLALLIGGAGPLSVDEALSHRVRARPPVTPPPREAHA